MHIRHLYLTEILVSLLQRVTLQKRQSNQSAFAPSYGLRCAHVPSRRFCSVGTPRRAIHGPSRLSRHPCRSTHSTNPPLGLPGGQTDQKHCGPEAADRPACLAARSASPAHILCGSELARDGIGAIQLKYRAACIASKPASTLNASATVG